MSKPVIQPLIEIVRPDSVGLTYVEGLSQIMIGSPNSRLVLYQKVERRLEEGSQVETHYQNCELVMSTPAMIEMYMNILANCGKAKPELLARTEQWNSRVTDLYSKLTASDDASATPQAHGKETNG